MSKNIKKIEEKFGQPVYPSNPSVPDEGEIKRGRRAQIGTDRQGMVIDSGTGEILGHGGAIAYEWEEVDKERFVKLYLEGLKQAVGLSKAGLAVFQIVYDQVRENKGRDYVLISAATSGLVQQTYSRGLRELIDREFLFRSDNPGLFWVNIRFMFNGDRLAFVKGYRLKDSGRQAELPFGEPAAIEEKKE